MAHPKKSEQDLQAASKLWGLEHAKFVSETPRAIVYKVHYKGGHAALKIANTQIKTGEEHAAALYHLWNGQGAARLLQAGANLLLLEWMDGPDLTHLPNKGKDTEACEIIAMTAQKLHRFTPSKDLSKLGELLSPLLTDTGPDTDIHRAKELAKAKLADPKEPAVLHGDLHHENIRQSSRGWLAFDPKGVWGDPVYDVARAMLNPIGISEGLATPALMQTRADCYARAFGVESRTVLEWACIDAAISVIWAEQDGHPSTERRVLLSLLLSLCR